MSTKKQIDKKNIVQSIKQAAQIYKARLVGRTFLYVFDGRYIEVIYKSENFRHLTGVDTNVPAKRFYKLAVQNKLESNQIFFSARHPLSLCQKKLKHIMDIAAFASSESFMLEEICTDSYNYKFGTTDLSFSLCMGEDLDSNGNKKVPVLLYSLFAMKIASYGILSATLIRASPQIRQEAYLNSCSNNHPTKIMGYFKTIFLTVSLSCIQ